jgi:hypothetical protein
LVNWIEIIAGLAGAPALLADLDVEDIIKIVLFIIFVFGSLIAKGIGNLFESFDRNDAKKAARAGAAPEPDLEEQLNEWLRQEPQRDPPRAERPRPAGQRGRGAANRGRPQPPRQRNRPAAQPGRPADLGRPVVENQPPAQAERLDWALGGGQPVQAEVIAAQPVDQPARRVVAETVAGAAKAAAAREAAITAEVERLVSDIGLADERLEQHLRAAFRDRVKTLADEKGEVLYTIAEGTDAAGTASENEPDAMAVQIAQLMHSPQAMRDAVILAEILRRPTDRW